MLRGQMVVQMKTEVADDSRRLDLAQANLDIGVHGVQFCNVGL